MSNNTPRKQQDETASEHRQRSPAKLVLGLLMILFGIAAVWNGVRGTPSSVLTAPKGVINLEVLDSESERKLGLSGRESLSENDGLLFKFDTLSMQNCFWMKDMKFPIDMIWLDTNKQVVTIIEDVSPDTYPQSFCPASEALYGLELESGRANELGIAEGITLSF